MPSPAVLILNYPSNPTAQVMDLSFFEEVVAFARAHGLFILSDLAYAEIYFDGEPPPSVLQVPGAKDLAVEFTSMSKTYSMAGWDIPAPRATMFAWAPLPPAFVEMGSMKFSKLLLEHAKVAVAPGIGFGEYGEGYVRIALVENTQRIRQAARNVRRFLRDSAACPPKVSRSPAEISMQGSALSPKG